MYSVSSFGTQYNALLRQTPPPRSRCTRKKKTIHTLLLDYLLPVECDVPLPLDVADDAVVSCTVGDVVVCDNVRGQGFGWITVDVTEPRLLRVHVRPHLLGPEEFANERVNSLAFAFAQFFFEHGNFRSELGLGLGNGAENVVVAVVVVIFNARYEPAFNFNSCTFAVDQAIRTR